MSTIPYETPDESNIYGIGSEHPFNNYWTLAGGLAEVISVLPTKVQCDVLIVKYFESVDAIYPMLYRPKFEDEYEAFWSLSFADRAKVDSSFVALLLVMMAMGTQFLRLPGDPLTAQQNQSSSAEFYASASHQALRLGAYLNRATVQVLQAMVLMTYFLVNGSHASDAWAFSGIIIRQAYAIGLNRDQSLLFDPNLNEIQKIERRRVWIAIVAQDAFLAAILRLPPCATFSDFDQARPQSEGLVSTPSSSDSSGGSPGARRTSFGPGQDNSYENPDDLVYVRGIYTLAILVQRHISGPRSLSLPMAASVDQRNALIDRFESLYNSWPEVFRCWKEHTMYEMCHRDAAGRRIARQVFILSSNYWYCFTMIQLEGCEQLDIVSPRNKYQEEALATTVASALLAGHNSLNAFFLMHALLGEDAGTWWVMAQRAFTVAVSIKFRI